MIGCIHFLYFKRIRWVGKTVYKQGEMQDA